jgi:hypothetical protein
MTRRRRNPRRPKPATNKSGPPKTLNEAATQAGSDDHAAKLKGTPAQNPAPEDGDTDFEMMAQKWRERQALFRADWESAARKDRRRFIVEPLEYPLKRKKEGKTKKHA